MTKSAAQELKLNVSHFYGNDDTRRLIASEEAAQFNNMDDDGYFYQSEKFYEDQYDDALIDVINRLHNPVGDLTLRRTNHTLFATNNR
ncbi:hypothetical protein DICVIV_13461 [Dictyocaulus viviparus]|uniref:Uncharacterized protein n=1 Tax=Dictyocaulus viviparus TaxID=29172 RepID=A0A0D8XAB8_DICVI|nr:hypothetical protein DICVIV_13461 [Dictyocaulus viviparus]